MKKSFVSLDIETSGFSPNYGGRIIEIGLCKVVDGEIVDTYSELFNPNLKISNKIEELTGIKNEELKGKKTLHERLPFIYNNYIKGENIVIHRAKFDWDLFLKPELEKMGFTPQNTIVDTQYVASTLLSEKKSNLKHLCQKYKVENDNPHRALSDAIATANLFLVLQKKLDTDMLFSGLIEEEEKVDKLEVDDVEIHRIKLWQKEVNKQMYNRVYVASNIGTFYYDINKNLWMFKEKKTPKEVDFLTLETAVLKKMGISKEQFLKKYRK